MIESKRYIPTLKWKAAEQAALQRLALREKNYITPLIQIVMPKPKKLREQGRPRSLSELFDETVELLNVKLPQIPEQIVKHWGKAPAFIDLSLIHSSLIRASFIQILKKGRHVGLSLIPVIRLNTDNIIQKTVVSLANENKSGLCLKLFRSDFIDLGALNRGIKNFLNINHLSENEIDIIVDFQVTDDECLELQNISYKIPNLHKWRSFVFISGSFPIDLNNAIVLFRSAL